MIGGTGLSQALAGRWRLGSNSHRFNSSPEGCRYVASHEELQDHERQLLETLAFQHGETYDSYLLLEESRQYFVSSTSGVVGFETWRNHLYVVGGLLAPTAEKPRLLRQFLAFARSNGLSPHFFNILRTDRDLFRHHGLLVSKIGEEPVVDLRATDWGGKAYAWVRRQENFCKRAGVVSKEVRLDAIPEVERRVYISKLNQLSEEHVAATAFGRELSLTVGKANFERMHRRRLFVAESSGTPVAFVIANPAYAGEMWSIETYRRGTDAPRG